MLPCPLQVLTRRDQLKFKEEKQKNENPEDACDDTKEEDGEEPEPAQKKKVRANAKKAKGEGKANGKAKAKDKAETKAKVSKGKKKHEPGMDEEGDDQQEAEQKVKVSDDFPMEETQEASDAEINNVKTPKKTLFQSDDESDDGNDGMPTPITKFIDPTTGEERTLQEIFDNYVPAAWKRSKGQRSSDDSTKPGPPTPKAKSRAKAKAKAGSKVPEQKAAAKVKAEAKGKAKSNPKSNPKSKAKSKAQDTPSPSKRVMASPAIKKEIKRRKKQDAQAMAEQAQDMKDHMMQGIFVQKIKNVVGLEWEECKEMLKEKDCPMYPMTYLSAYWSRQAVAVVLRDDNTGKPSTHLEYFGFSKGESKNVNLALAYVAAWLMVSCHLMDGPSCLFFLAPTTNQFYIYSLRV